MKHITAFLSLFLFLLVAAAPAWADCRYNGKDYPVGAVVDGKVCTKDGWQSL